MFGENQTVFFCDVRRSGVDSFCESAKSKCIRENDTHKLSRKSSIRYIEKYLKTKLHINIFLFQIVEICRKNLEKTS